MCIIIKDFFQQRFSESPFKKISFKAFDFFRRVKAFIHYRSVKVTADTDKVLAAELKRMIYVLIDKLIRISFSEEKRIKANA